MRLREGLDPAIGDHVIYPTETGEVPAQVVWRGQRPDRDDIPTCVRVAEPKDLGDADRDRWRRAEARAVVDKIVADLGLEMKVMAVDYQVRIADRPLTVVYYTAPERVDFRELVAQMSSVLDSQIDMRQVAMREAACLVKAQGVCGRQTCCSSWIGEMRDFVCARASMRLTNSERKNLGVCGCTMCCMRFAPAPQTVDEI